MSGCFLCPLACGADRDAGYGVCGATNGRAYIARAARHYFEEPPISGTRGSGAIFFCGCNMKCVFCQNYEISRAYKGRSFDVNELGGLFLHMQALGAHNVNLVTPSPHVKLICGALEAAKRNGLTIPVVYNTNAYELVDTLKRLEGLVDIYLPDLKYVGSIASKRYSGVDDYFAYAAPAILEMQRQCGTLVVDADGIALRGLIIRHLVLPGSVDEARNVMRFIVDNLPIDTAFSLMSQYVPMYDATFAPLNRRLTRNEYSRAIDFCLDIGLTRTFTQDLSAASAAYTPDFDGNYE